jgi:DUF971 family protein
MSMELAMHQPTEIKLLQKSRVLEITFEDGQSFSLPCEYLRVYSPSAEVRGHSFAHGKTEVGKEKVNIIGMEPVGQYAIKLVFDDGHDTGIYSFDWLYELGVNQESYWQRYLEKCAAIQGSNL